MQHPFAPTAGSVIEAEFTYKSTADFAALIFCQGGSLSYYQMISCPASSQWKTVTFVTTALPSAPENYIDFRFYSTGALTLDNVSVVEQG